MKIPTFNHPSSNTDQSYQLLLVDLSINSESVNTSALTPGVQVPLTQGISPGRTTRLHYWQTGIKFTTNGTLVNTTEPIAFYQGPAPPPGDIAHTYAFYLFEESSAFAPPPPGNPFNQANVNKGMNRMSFSVAHLASETGVGPLVAANFILVQNAMQATSSAAAPSASATAKPSSTGTSGSGSGSGTSGSGSPSITPFTAGARQIGISTGMIGVIFTVVTLLAAVLTI